MKRVWMIAALVSFVGAACNMEEDKSVDVNPDIATEGQNLGKADGPNDRFQGDITFDDRQIAYLPQGVRYHMYRIEVTGSNQVFIDLASRDGGDTFLILYRWNGSAWTYVSHNDDCASFDTLNSCMNTSLDDGTFLVLATTYQYAAYNYPAELDYELEIFCEGGSCASQVCGTRGAGTCGENEYCDWGDNSCGVVDAPGTCTARPDTCTEQYAPVCGCDGVTYSNECFAAMAGADIKYTGACPGTIGATCGGIASLQCNEGLRCDYSNNDSCFIADMAGVCVEDEPVLCTMEYNPVCGCNGVTYGNDCQRRGAGVPLDHLGACTTN